MASNRLIKKQIYIFCEGRKGKSEYRYLMSFINDKKSPKPSIIIQIVDSIKTTPKELIDEAKKLRLSLRRNENWRTSDEIWVVFDKNHYTKHPEAFQNAKDSKISIAFNAICFEYWILLHYEYTTAQFESCNKCISKIKAKNRIPNYNKSYPKLYKDTKDKLEIAKHNAKKLREFHKPTHNSEKPYEIDAWTNMDELIESIEQAGREY